MDIINSFYESLEERSKLTPDIEKDFNDLEQDLKNSLPEDQFECVEEFYRNINDQILEFVKEHGIYSLLN